MKLKEFAGPVNHLLTGLHSVDVPLYGGYLFLSGKGRFAAPTSVAPLVNGVIVASGSLRSLTLFLEALRAVHS